MGNMLTGIESKLTQFSMAVLVFALFIALLVLAARTVDRWPARLRDRASVLIFVGPALLLLLGGLIYPAARTAYLSLLDANGDAPVGLANYLWLLQDPQSLRAIGNTLLWVLVVPVVSVGVGLVYAILVDGRRFEKLAKTLLFMPMAISFVGAGIIWKFVYTYRQAGEPQIGLINQVLVWLGLSPQQLLLGSPLNSLLLMVVMIWIQAGFAMVILSAAIKAIPDDIVEAARLDGVNATQMFRHITLPTIRPSIVVVMTTISIGMLKVFDIVRTMTGGQFDTAVIANSMYDLSFRYGESGKGAAVAVLLFAMVLPLIVFNAVQMRKNKEVRG